MDPKDKHQHPIPDDRKSELERQQVQRETEHNAAMAPNQNRPPTEQHRGGPLPYMKK
jgi:hypothetical protein